MHFSLVLPSIQMYQSSGDSNSILVFLDQIQALLMTKINFSVVFPNDLIRKIN